MLGPGVTPDLMWEARAPYSATADRAADAVMRELHAGDNLCHPN